MGRWAQASRRGAGPVSSPVTVILQSAIRDSSTLARLFFNRAISVKAGPTPADLNVLVNGNPAVTISTSANTSQILITTGAMISVGDTLVITSTPIWSYSPIAPASTTLG